MDPLTTSGCSPPTVRSGSPWRDPAPHTIIQSARIPLRGVNAPHPAPSPPHARHSSTPPPTKLSSRPPTTIQLARVSDEGLDDRHPALPSPHFPADSTPPTFSGASSPSPTWDPQLGADDLDGSLFDDEDASSSSRLFYERWAPIIVNCSFRTELDMIASNLA